jgi:hypothetical protein
MRGFGLRRGRRCLLGLNAAIHEDQSRDGGARQRRRNADLAQPHGRPPKLEDTAELAVPAKAPSLFERPSEGPDSTAFTLA